MMLQRAVGNASARASRSACLASFLFPRAIDLSREAAMHPFRERPVVILSPHLDDACFSLGAFLGALGRGTLLNVYTQSINLADGARAAKLCAAEITALRHREDRAFAERCGLVRRDLGLCEPPLRGDGIYDLARLEARVAIDSEAVLRALVAISDSFGDGERGFLFVPLAVGAHLDHRALLEIVLRNAAVLRDRFDLLFYEDQPYAMSLRARLDALAYVDAMAGHAAPVRFARAPRWSQKRALVELYASQWRAAPRRRQFWPPAATPLAPHEAFWSFAPFGAAQGSMKFSATRPSAMSRWPDAGYAAPAMNSAERLSAIDQAV